MTAGDVVLDWVVPIAGGLVTIVMFCCPLPAVLRARRDKDLGDLNPLPFAAVLFNSVGWVIYSLVVNNYLLYWPNEVGTMLGLFMTLSCYGLADQQTREYQLWVCQFFAFLLSLVGAISVFVPLRGKALKWTWGFTVNFILLVYYAAPLSTTFRVIKRRDSSSLHLPMGIMNLLTGSLWVAYGIAIDDMFVAVPNGIGAGFAVVILLLIWIFPSKRPRSRTIQPLAALSMRRRVGPSLSDRILNSLGLGRRRSSVEPHAEAGEPCDPETPSDDVPGPQYLEKPALAVHVTVLHEHAEQQQQQQQDTCS